MRSNLAKERRKALLTQAEIATKISVSIRHYNSLEAGTSNGSVEIWQKLKSLLKAPSIDYLLEQEVGIEKQQEARK